MLEPTASCFWGICPEQTTLQEATDIFTHLGLVVEHTNTRKDKEFYYAEKNSDNGLEINLVLTIQDNLVKNFEVNIRPEEEQAGVPRAWLAYSPETLIDHYGTPTKIEVFVGGGPRPQYAMDIYFYALDLIIEYFSFKDTKIKSINSFRLCPLIDQYETLTIWLGKEPEYPPLSAMQIEEATSISLIEFSDLIKGDPNKACVEIPQDVMFP